MSTAPNAERLGQYLTSHAGTSGTTAPGRRVGDYAVLLEEFGLPGLPAPPDVSAVTALKWSHSVTVAVLRHLRREGHPF